MVSINSGKTVKMAHKVDDLETMNGSLTDVRAFCRVVELGTLSAAARVLGETKGSISRRLRRLESSLGLTLLARHPRSVTVTGEGQLFYGKAREGLLLLEEGAELARATRSEPRGVLRITAPLDLGQEWLPPIIVDFARQYPQIRVELLLSDQRLDLASHQIDVALRATEGGLPDMGYSARALTPLTMGWFAAPDYLAQAPAPQCPEDLHGHALILAGQGSQGCRVRLRQGAMEEQLTFWPRLQTLDYASVLRLALCGGGLGFMPSLVAAQAVSRGQLQPVLTAWQAPAAELYLITQSGLRAPGRVQAFKEFLLAALAVD
ncbi:LysR substrate-binding domain-containing protein [Pseudaeromonas paramecii]|uniref:LysR substrate-binding domain-containing protein n=2 Tax=Pseudaeromonas paramecii TaxID=2138166 RepID=A0ABP8Q9T2_9GAMM